MREESHKGIFFFKVLDSLIPIESEDIQEFRLFKVLINAWHLLKYIYM